MSLSEKLRTAIRVATSYVAAGWQYEDTIDGNGQLANPPDPSERIEATAIGHFSRR